VVVWFALSISFITSIDEVKGVTLTDQCPLLPCGSSSSQTKMAMAVVASVKKPFSSWMSEIKMCSYFLGGK
jgi:hypothetical protein